VPRLPSLPDVPLREALLLLPSLPDAATVHGSADRWAAALASWGVALGATGSSGGLAVGSQAEPLARSGAEQVLLEGSDRRGLLAQAGYDVTTWRLSPTHHGTTGLIASGDAALARELRTGGGRRRPRQVAADLVRRAQGQRCVTRGLRRPALPLALQPLQPAPAGYVLLVGGASARRRPVFLLGRPGGGVERVVKVDPGEQGAARGEAEQRVLAQLAELGLPGVPVGLGNGSIGRLSWSAETAVPGSPLLDALRGLPAARGLRVLEGMAHRLTELAAKTAGPRAADAGLRLRGPHRAAAQLVPTQGRGVLVHGDVPGNAMLDGDRPWLVDWETARSGGLPLHDLLPLLCLGLAAVRRVPEHETADVLLAAMRGSSTDSPWLLDQIRRYLRRLDVPLQDAGALAGISLASWASMRLVHDELVVSVGGEVTPWVSPAEVMTLAWREDPTLGTRWDALTG
jgi:hypothetical protein